MVSADEVLQNADDHNAIADMLCVAPATVRRWKARGRVPEAYRADIRKWAGLPTDDTGTDQFYTPKNVAEYCYRTTVRCVQNEDAFFVEPSVGKGAFWDLLPQGRRIGMDIDPRGLPTDVMRQDYLAWDPATTKMPRTAVVVIGNPPFGLRGNLALRFIRHSSTFATHIAFILPPLFASDGKGSPRTRIRKMGFELVHEECLKDVRFLDPEDRPVHLATTVFQVWRRALDVEPQEGANFTAAAADVRVYSLSDGGTNGTVRNRTKLHACDMYLPSSCYGADKMRAYESFEDLPHRRGYGVCFCESLFRPAFRQICWSDAAFRSTNGAYNLRKSIIVEQFRRFIIANRL